MIILRSWLTRQAVVLGCAAVAAVPVLAGIAAAPGASAVVSQARSPRIVPGGRQLWIAKYNQGSGAFSVANLVAVNPAGTVVFVTGGSTPGSAGSTFPFDYATIAYNAVTGMQMWVSRYDGPGHGNDFATGLVLAPHGGPVVVT